ncbi:hypothetical protein M0812_07224 [Anaeramoeba flamelloides]|uniref:BTB domain-containing protein n=1 Tax=Anaeramoeba flamelloides TaxID=1746091 RepID=A0AAV8ADZ0_9EUKA|nr:hypothetical protein M0812_07224 [Anaeramoeba flamelloides]
MSNSKSTRKIKQTKTNNHQVYFAGPIYEFSFLTSKSKSKLPNWSPLTSIDELERIKKIVVCHKANCLVWKNPNKLEFYQKDKEKTEFQLPKKERIKDIVSGDETYLILTRSGKVFSLADKLKNSLFDFTSSVPLKDPEKSTFGSIRFVDFFEKNNLLVDSIAMSERCNFFLCTNGKLYGNGFNQFGQLGNGTKENQQLPTLLAEKVTRIFSGTHSFGYFYTTSQNEVYSGGDNCGGQLSMGSNNNNLPFKIPKCNASKIQDIKCGTFFSMILTKSGQLYSCGSKKYNGIGEDKYIFTQIPGLETKKTIQINAGTNYGLALTSEYELFGWGFDQDNMPTPQYSRSKPWRVPRKIALPRYFESNNNLKQNMQISCGIFITFIYPAFNNSNYGLLKDFKNLYKLYRTKKYCDSFLDPLNEKFPIHKLLVECRTGCKLSKIQKLFIETENSLGQKNATEINDFLKWVYYDKKKNVNEPIFKLVFNNLKSTFPSPENSLQEDLYRLYKNEESKDFNILVELSKKETVVKKKEHFGVVKVHKLLLIARSGLFRSLFDFDEENINQIKDYSGKSIESLQILIKYFYTNKIQLNKTCKDPKPIIEELKDSIEYYQLNEDSNLLEELEKIKRKAKRQK